jgi:hypothetical protein
MQDSDRLSAPQGRITRFIIDDDDEVSMSLASRLLKRNATSIKSLAARSSRTCSIDGNRSSTGSMLRALPSFQSSRMSLRAESNFIDKGFADSEEDEIWSPEHHDQIINWLSSQATDGSLHSYMGKGPIQLMKLSGGLCNSVYMAQSDDTGQMLVIKHCKPFLSPDVQLPDYSAPENPEEVNLEAIQRMETEAAGLSLASRVAPGHVPKLLVHEIIHNQGAKNNGFMALEFLPDREMLSEALARGALYPSLGKDLGAFLGKMIIGGSIEALGPDAFRTLCETLDASAPVAELMTVSDDQGFFSLSIV